MHKNYHEREKLDDSGKLIMFGLGLSLKLTHIVHGSKCQLAYIHCYISANYCQQKVRHSQSSSQAKIPEIHSSHLCVAVIQLIHHQAADITSTSFSSLIHALNLRLTPII